MEPAVGESPDGHTPSPKNGGLFPLTVLPPHAPSVLPPKGVHWRTFLSMNCRLFALNQEIMAYFRIVRRNLPFYATLYDPKCRFLPKEARNDPGMGGWGYHPPLSLSGPA